MQNRERKLCSWGVSDVQHSSGAGVFFFKEAERQR